MKRILFTCVMLFLVVRYAAAQLAVCDTMVLTHVDAGIRFQSAMFSAPDSSIAIPMVNNTATNFAYPQIKLINTTPLPPGMTLYTMGWNVFASAWNVGDTATAYTDYYVNTVIPDNYTVTFRLYATNFAPLSTDSCVFSSTFDINLKPIWSASVGSDITPPVFTFYPNPANDYIDVCGVYQRSEVDIFTATGVLVQSVVMTNTTTRIDVHHLPGGIYLLHDRRSGQNMRLIKI